MTKLWRLDWRRYQLLTEFPAQADTLGDLLVLGHSAQVNAVFDFYPPTNS